MSKSEAELICANIIAEGLLLDLSDGRTFIVTLDELLTLEPEMLEREDEIQDHD